MATSPSQTGYQPRNTPAERRAFFDILKRIQQIEVSGGGSLPPGGTTGQVLAKQSATDGDATWVPPAPKGDPGVQGPPGPVGPTGATGATGPPGTTGAQGPKGDTGAQGAQGIPGTTGAQGPKGDTGATGATGPPGADSTVPGPQGPAGPTGATGSQGPAGATGAQGPAGATGAQGPPGDPLVFWPVGSILTSTSATNPAALLGGTWVAIDPGPALAVDSPAAVTIYYWNRTA